MKLAARVGPGCAPISLSVILVTVVIAIPRYRLYEIDLLLRGTLVYGVLTALLGAVYTMLVLSLGSLRRDGGEPPSWAVAGATLAVAAPGPAGPTAHPGGVDRRFNRRRYDAARTIEASSGRLRQQTDLATLATELLEVSTGWWSPPRRRSGLDPPRGVQRHSRCSSWHRSGC
jgi:hypothetical protein